VLFRNVDPETSRAPNRHVATYQELNSPALESLRYAALIDAEQLDPAVAGQPFPKRQWM